MTTILETDRFRLRRFEEDDFGNLFVLHSDPEVMRFSSRRSPESDIEVAATLKRLIQRYRESSGFGIWAAELKSSGEFIGWFGLDSLPGTSEIEVGYRLLRRHWGSGFATEGTRELLSHAFHVLGLKKIVAISDLDNIASKRVLEKSGFIYSGELEYEASLETPKEIVSWFIANR